MYQHELLKRMFEKQFRSSSGIEDNSYIVVW